MEEKHDKFKEIELLFSSDADIARTVRNIEHAKKELEITIDSLSDILLLLTRDGKILRCNRAIEDWELGKVSCNEATSYHDLFHPECDDNHCHMLTSWVPAMERIKKLQGFEYNIHDKLMKRFLLIQFRPLPTQHELSDEIEEAFCVMIVKDITSRKHAEIELEKTLSELRTIFRILPDQSIRLSMDGTILELLSGANNDNTFLQPNIVGEKIQDISPPAIGEKFTAAISELMKTKSLVQIEYSLGSRNKAQFFESRFLPLMDEQIIMINQDVTEKKRLESIAESHDMFKKLGYIFSAIRHEIGNPINAIKITASVLKKNIGKFSNEKISEYTDRILSQLNRVEFLLKSFKSFNMFEDLEPSNINIGEFLEQFVFLLSEDLKDKEILLNTRLASPDDTVYADPRALHHVLLNIIGNAMDAVKENSEKRIEIVTSKDNNKIWIEIKDNGHGFSESQMKSIFKPFYTTKPDGTGLGLVIVKKILTRMNGEIEIESVENVGTIVSFSIPEGTFEYT